MAETADPASMQAAAERSVRRRASVSREDRLEQQITSLRSDFKAIAATLAGMAEDRVAETRATAKREVRSIAGKGQHAFEEIQDEFTHIERQLKDTIRQRPLTAVAGAVAVGFVLALLSR
jgi:ElaB/YqjD/DUF883 family membrane-anchored ribosome-binding protein